MLLMTEYKICCCPTIMIVAQITYEHFQTLGVDDKTHNLSSWTLQYLSIDTKPKISLNIFGCSNKTLEMRAMHNNDPLVEPSHTNLEGLASGDVDV